MKEKRWSAVNVEVVLKQIRTFFPSKGVPSLATSASQSIFKFPK